MAQLPTDVEATYSQPDDPADVTEHQQGHDELARGHNEVDGGAFLAANEPAGGDLTGIYPNPSVAAESIGDGNIDPNDPIGRDKLVAPEAKHLVGAAGEPAFQDSWSASGGGLDVPGFWFDSATGLVHLSGAAMNTDAAHFVIFTLPQGYIPSAVLSFAVIGTVGGTADARLITVHANGAVYPTYGAIYTNLYFNGIYFRV